MTMNSPSELLIQLRRADYHGTVSVPGDRPTTRAVRPGT